jgi:hypothetical protein
MTIQVAVSIDDARLERARIEAEARGLTVEAYLTELIMKSLPTEQPIAHGDVSSIFGLVKDGEPTDIAKDKDKLIDAAVLQEYLEETGRK